MRAIATWLFNKPYLLLTIVAMSWGGNAVAGKMAAGVIPPFTLTFLRWVLTALALYILARPMLAEHMPTIKQRWRYMFFCGAVGFATFNFALYGALNFTSAINVAIEQSGMPMVIMLLTYLIYREPVTPLQIIGACLSIFGVIWTATRGVPSALFTLDVNVGDAIMLIGVLAYGIYSVALKSKPDMPWQVFVFCLSVAAMITAFPAALIEMSTGALPAADWRTPALLAFVVLFPSLLAQVFYVRGVELIGASRAGLFINLVPVFAAVFAVLLLGETFFPYHSIGLALVIGGIMLSEASARRQRVA